MPADHVNYDQIAPAYHQRYALNALTGVAASLHTLARECSAQRVLEVGCGTGRWLAELQGVACQVYGLDLSSGMLRQARERDTQFRLTCGRASHLPFPDAAFDLVFCVNALHHFDRPRVFVSEARRLLRPGGALAVVGMDPHTDGRGLCRRGETDRGRPGGRRGRGENARLSQRPFPDDARGPDTGKIMDAGNS